MGEGGLPKCDQNDGGGWVGADMKGEESLPKSYQSDGRGLPKSDKSEQGQGVRLFTKK